MDYCFVLFFVYGCFGEENFYYYWGVMGYFFWDWNLIFVGNGYLIGVIGVGVGMGNWNLIGIGGDELWGL